MYTQCFHCWSILAIRADAIRVARGKARCGQCFAEFDVLETLSDTLAEVLAEGAGRNSKYDLASGAIRPAALAAAEPPRAAVGTRGERGPVHGDRAGPEARPINPPEGDDKYETAEFALSPSDRVPEVLREAFEAGATGHADRTRRLTFGAGSVVLLVLLAAQSIWFAAEAISTRYPALLPVLESFCRYSGCELGNPRDPTQIHMISRDVRVHPDYEGALRVIGSMVNRLPRVQPYPQMRFTLFNVNGEVIVGRTFRPEEYLASEIDVAAGMPSLEPVQIVLDLLALEEAAVSFEFRFL